LDEVRAAFASIRYERASAAFLVLMFWSNFSGMKDLSFSGAKAVQNLIYALNLNQSWSMFAPYPIRNDGWFILDAHFADGTSFDLMTGKAPTTRKPELVSALFPSSEWRKLYLNLWDQSSARILLPFARFQCRSQVSATGARLSTLRIIYMKEMTPPMGRSFPSAEPVVLWSHDCFK
jgi:hypothetical protein